MPVFDFSQIESGSIGLAYPKQVGELSILQRATMAECLQREVPANGEILDFEGQQPAWADVIDALIAADLVTARLCGTEGFPLASKVVEHRFRGDVGEVTIGERASVIEHWLAPMRWMSILERVARMIDAAPETRNGEVRSRVN